MTSNLPVIAQRGAALSRDEVLASFFQGLADPTRVRILELLRERPRTVTELVADLGLAQGRVSSHLSCLRWCGYVLGEVDGRFTRYRLIDLLSQTEDLADTVVDQPIAGEAPVDLTQDVAAPAQAAEMARNPSLGDSEVGHELGDGPRALT